VAVPLGLGHVWERLRSHGLDHFPEWMWLYQLPPDGFFQSLSPRMELLCVALGLWIPTLLGQGVLRRSGQRLAWALIVLLVAVLFNALSAALTYGPEHAWFWVNAQVFGGLAVGLLLSVASIKLSLRWSLGLMVLAQLILLMWLVMVLFVIVLFVMVLFVMSAVMVVFVMYLVMMLTFVMYLVMVVLVIVLFVMVLFVMSLVRRVAFVMPVVIVVFVIIVLLFVIFVEILNELLW
jgi:hypothetical protein